jgi:hypothetical protein
MSPNRRPLAQNAANASLAEKEAARDALAPRLPLTNGLTGLERTGFCSLHAGIPGRPAQAHTQAGVLSETVSSFSGTNPRQAPGRGSRQTVSDGTGRS